jgi:hypothetical protein
VENPSLITAIVAIAGGLCNLVWMLINLRLQNRVLRIETRIGGKIDDLKDWMGERYVSVKEFEGFQGLVEQRHAEVTRRLGKLEGAKA